MDPNNYQILVYDNGKYADSPLYFFRLRNGMFTPQYSAICRLLYKLDEWYGNTEQEVEEWALEYQLWARMLLSSNTPAIMLNPRYLLIADVLSEITEILGDIGCHADAREAYADMVRNAAKLSFVKPQDGTPITIQWPPAFDAALLELPKPDTSTIADYIELAKLLGANEDEQLLMLYIEGDGNCACGLMHNNTADGNRDFFEVARREGRFQNAVREVLNDANLETENGEYVFAGVRTKLLKKLTEKE